jgi:hypothetical protein
VLYFGNRRFAGDKARGNPAQGPYSPDTVLIAPIDRCFKRSGVQDDCSSH